MKNRRTNYKDKIRENVIIQMIHKLFFGVSVAISYRNIGVEIMFKGNYRWVLGWFVFFITFIGYMDRVNLSVATPAIMGDFGFDKIQMGWVQTAFFAGYAAMQIPGGIMANMFGHRKVVCGAITWWSAFTALTAACSSFTPFVRCSVLVKVLSIRHLLTSTIVGITEQNVLVHLRSCLQVRSLVRSLDRR